MFGCRPSLLSIATNPSVATVDRLLTPPPRRLSFGLDDLSTSPSLSGKSIIKAIPPPVYPRRLPHSPEFTLASHDFRTTRRPCSQVIHRRTPPTVLPLCAALQEDVHRIPVSLDVCHSTPTTCKSQADFHQHATTIRLSGTSSSSTMDRARAGDPLYHRVGDQGSSPLSAVLSRPFFSPDLRVFLSTTHIIPMLLI